MLDINRYASQNYDPFGRQDKMPPLKRTPKLVGPWYASSLRGRIQCFEVIFIHFFFFGGGGWGGRGCQTFKEALCGDKGPLIEMWHKIAPLAGQRLSQIGFHAVSRCSFKGTPLWCHVLLSWVFGDFRVVASYFFERNSPPVLPQWFEFPLKSCPFVVQTSPNVTC